MPDHVRSIRQMAASRRGDVVAAAEFESVVHLFDLKTRRLVRTIETTLDFGGTRLAVSDDGGTVVAGSYRRHGVAAYSTDSGVELWRRRDLKKVQHLKFNADSSRVLCGFEEGRLKALTRQRVRRLNGCPGFAGCGTVRTARCYSWIGGTGAN